MTNSLYFRYEKQLEDFWNRRKSNPTFQHAFSIFGCPVEIASNRPEFLKAVEISKSLYSTAPLREPDHAYSKRYRLQFIFTPPLVEPGPLHDNLFPIIHYTANGDWLNMNLGGWGNCFTDLQTGFGVAVLVPALADQPDSISRHLINTLFNNYFTRNGFTMLHATALVQGNRVLLLMAPHNSGKSTTALRLTLSGQFQLLSDSQIYITTTAHGLQLTGFPVGRGKLRRDMIPHFPSLAGMLTPEEVRDETKFILDLRALDPKLVIEEAVYPDEVTWCLLSRTGKPETNVREASQEEVWEAVMLNSLHFDEPVIWERNLHRVVPLMRMARFCHLEIGTDGDGILEKLSAL